MHVGLSRKSFIACHTLSCKGLTRQSHTKWLDRRDTSVQGVRARCAVGNGSAGCSTTITATRHEFFHACCRHGTNGEVGHLGAAVSREFGYELLAMATPTCERVLHDALAQLIKAGLRYRHHHPGGWRSSSVSPLTPIHPHRKHLPVH
jgi:hypothetical protein